MASLKIRLATFSDGDAVATLFMRTWHISLKPMLPDGFLDQFHHDVQAQKYAARAEDPNWLLYVAEHDRKIVGVIGSADNKTAPLKFQKQIKAMYVDPDYQRQRIGVALFDRLIDGLQQQKVRNVCLWCIAANDRARSFYQRQGSKQIKSTRLPNEYAAMPHVLFGWDRL